MSSAKYQVQVQRPCRPDGMQRSAWRRAYLSYMTWALARRKRPMNCPPMGRQAFCCFIPRITTGTSSSQTQPRRSHSDHCICRCCLMLDTHATVVVCLLVMAEKYHITLELGYYKFNCFMNVLNNDHVIGVK